MPITLGDTSISAGVTASDYNLYQGLVARVGNGAGIGINSANSTDNAYIYFGYGTTSGQQQGAAIGRIGGDELALFTASTERMRLDSTGNLKFNSGYGSVGTAYGCRAWVNFNGTGTVAIRGSGNVSSITDSGNGDYRVNFTTAMPDVNYATVATVHGGSNRDTTTTNVISTSQVAVTTGTPHVSGQTSGVLIDNAQIFVATFR